MTETLRYVTAGAVVARQLLERAIAPVLGPLYPVYKLGEFGLGKLDQAALGSKRSGTNAALYQALTFDITGLTLNVLGVGKKRRKYTPEIDRIQDASKAFWEGGGTAEDISELMRPNPFGIPILFAEWDVLGSAKRLQKRMTAELKDPDLEAGARERAAQFCEDPTSTHAFNAAQLSAWKRYGLASACRAGRAAGAPPSASAARFRRLRL